MSGIASPAQPKTRLTTDELVLVAAAVSGFLTVYVQVAVLLFVSVFALVKRRDMWRDRVPETIMLGCFWLLTIVVTAVYGTPIMVLLSFALGFACVDIIYVSKHMTVRAFDAIAQLTCFASVPCLIVALIQKALGMSWTYGERYCSVFFNANFYGLVATLTILFCVYNLCKVKRPLHFVTYFALIAVNVVAIYLTGSRMPVVVTVVGVICLLIVSRKWRVLGITCGALLFVVVLDIATGSLVDVIPRMDELAESFVGRWEIWKNAVASIKLRPIFGYGTYSYARVYEEMGGWYAIHAHNLVLELLMDYGIVGLGLLVAFFTRVMVKTFKAAAISQDKHRLGVVVAAFVITLLSGIFDLAMFWPQTAAIICFAMSAGTAIQEQ